MTNGLLRRLTLRKSPRSSTARRLRALSFAASLLVAAGPAAAATVKGTVVFPAPTDAAGKAVRARPLAHWRVENGVIPIAPALPEPRDGVVVVLEPQQAAAPPARLELKPEGDKPKITILEVRPMRVEPRLLVVESGAPIALRNADKAPRTFYLENGESFVPRQVTAPGSDRELKFTERGEYHLIDAEHPRASAVVVVVASPFHAISDDRGTFAIDVPDGKYAMKALFRGAWTVPQPVEVSQGKGHELTVKLPSDSDGEKPAVPKTDAASPDGNPAPNGDGNGPADGKPDGKSDKKPDPKSAKKAPAKKVEKK